MAIRVPRVIGGSNNVGELVAIKKAIEECPLDEVLEIRSDSRVSIDGLTKNLQRWENDNYLGVENEKLFRATGHAGEAGNEAADKLAKEETRKPIPDLVEIQEERALLLPGAKLQSITQSKAYKMIRQVKMKKRRYQEKLKRKATQRNMELTKEAAADEKGGLPETSSVWKSTRHKDVSRSGRFFLWMLIHDGYKVGKHWAKIEGHEYKATCTHCGITESMAHILTKCDAPGQEQIWEMASELWELWELKTGEELPRPTTGQIMACATTRKKDAGTTRLFRILMSESAFLIWRLRNERVIQEKPPASLVEIHNRWLRTMNIRLKLDCALTDAGKYEKKALKKDLVLKTWVKVLKNEANLPKDWTREAEVLNDTLCSAQAPRRARLRPFTRPARKDFCRSDLPSPPTLPLAVYGKSCTTEGSRTEGSRTEGSRTESSRLHRFVREAHYVLLIVSGQTARAPPFPRVPGHSPFLADALHPQCVPLLSISQRPTDDTELRRTW
ncbi:hypothetical protein B0H16DRAFT_1883688 [Mycena metata]|uniref:ribonuclease H n=1 Tax=Mycena metata TaxID=1033252 RepID=A0AAD7JGG3_9AGAR|nr:hypothetical protein B0H16DRAFT_1883688 [Mycena metata]